MEQKRQKYNAAPAWLKPNKKGNKVLALKNVENDVVFKYEQLLQLEQIY